MSERAVSLPVAPTELRRGETMPRYEVGPLTRTDFVRYAGASGDFNPLHHDEPAARAAGYPAVFGMGLFTAGLLGNRLARWVGPANVRDYSVRFTGQVWPGDMLTFSGTVEDVEADSDRSLARLSLSVTASSAGEVLRGQATVTAAAPVGSACESGGM